MTEPQSTANIAAPSPRAGVGAPSPRAGVGAPSPRAGVGAWIGAILFGGGVATAGAFGVMALYAQASLAEGPSARAPLVVTAAELEMVGAYAALERYIGRIEPARETRAAFELNGIVRDVRVDEGDRVKTGQVLATLDIEALTLEDMRLEAERTALQAELALAEATTERRETLQGRGFESGQTLDEARFAAEAARARITGIEAQRKRLALDIEKSELLAPFDGVVATRAVDEGAVVGVGETVATLQETTRPQARIGVPVEIAQLLRVGQTMRLAIATERVEGRLAAISPDLDPTTRTVALLIDVPPGDNAVMGEIARLDLERRIDQEGAWVPLSALREATRGLWALQTVVPRDGAANDVASDAGADALLTLSSAVVEVIYVRDNAAFVRGSVIDGALIVVDGPHRGAAGQTVVVEPATKTDFAPSTAEASLR